MPQLIARLAAVCREHLLREKILVAPSLAIGHQIADAIAHSGTPWVNLRVETIRTLADGVAGFAIAAEGLTVVSRAQALSLIERACDRVLGSSSYFAALADRPGLHRAIQKSLEDLRHAGVSASSLRGRDFEDAAKARDLARILDAYNEEMERGRYVDRFGVLERATETLERRGSPAQIPRFAQDDTRGQLRLWGPGSPSDRSSSRPSAQVPRSARDDKRGSSDTGRIWLVVDDVELTAAEERFLRAIAGQWETVGAGGDTRAPLSMTFRRGVGEENEVRGAFRAVLEANGTFDDAEIVYTSRDPYLPLIYELAAEYEVPATFAEGIASYFTRPGQACLAFLRWIGEGWHAAELRPFAGSHYRILRRAVIGWGRERYLPRIDALIAEEEEEEKERENEETPSPGLRPPSPARAGEGTDGSDRAGAARAFVAELLEISQPVANGDDIDVATTARVMRDFVRRFGVIHNEVDAMARQGLERLFDELAAIGSSTANRTDVTRRLAEAVRELHVSASNPRPGFLHVAPVRAGGWAARRRMFVVGLDDERHPGSSLQDPIILDSEREAIGIPVVGDRPQRSTEQFRRLLGRASARDITLSWSTVNLKDRRERFPSLVLLSMFGETPKSGVKENFVDPQPLSQSEWWLLRRFVDGDSDSREAILEAWPNLKSGAEAETARDSDAITRWDGRIAAPPEILDPRLNERVYSASQLERMAGCPYRHFLERILHVKPLEEIVYEPDRWLEPGDYGTMLHEIFEVTMREICAAGAKPSLAFLPRMQQIADEVMRATRDIIPPPSEAAYERRRTEALDASEVFLRTEESACADVTPTDFELEFSDFRLPLGHGRSVLLRGRIDRVDHDETHDEWHVWDYKSGSKYDFERGGQLQCGTKIQHAIYARVIEEKTGGRVTKSGYYFPTARGAGARIAFECSDKELRDALNLLFDTIRTGWFPHGSEDTCTFCDFKEVCGAAAEQTERKLSANPSDPAVQAWLALQEVK